MVKIPQVLIVCTIIVVVSITWSFLDPTLEPHLRKVKTHGPKPSKFSTAILVLAQSREHRIDIPVAVSDVRDLQSRLGLVGG